MVLSKFVPATPSGKRTLAVLAPMSLRHAQAVDCCFNAIAQTELAQNIFHVSF